MARWPEGDSAGYQSWTISSRAEPATGAASSIRVESLRYRVVVPTEYGPVGLGSRNIGSRNENRTLAVASSSTDKAVMIRKPRFSPSDIQATTQRIPVATYAGIICQCAPS